MNYQQIISHVLVRNMMLATLVSEFHASPCNNFEINDSRVTSYIYAAVYLHMAGNYILFVLIQKQFTDTEILCTNILLEKMTSPSVGLSGVNIIFLTRGLPAVMGHYISPF